LPNMLILLLYSSKIHRLQLSINFYERCCSKLSANAFKRFFGKIYIFIDFYFLELLPA